MKLITERLINKVETINNYLVDKVEQEPSYHHFIEELKLVINKLKQTKLKIKFVSHSLPLAETLKEISQQQITDRTYYQFQIESSQTEINKLLEDCDLLYLVRDYQLKISNTDKRLIRRANQANICQAIVNVEKTDEQNSVLRENHFDCIHTWLIEQEYHNVALFFLDLNQESNSQSSKQINDYYSFLERLLLDSQVKTETKITKQILTQVNQLFAKQRKSVWLQVKQGKQDLEQRQQECSQQKKSLLLPKNKKQLQNRSKELKKNINQKKIEIVNPFIPNSLIYKVEQLVIHSDVTVIEENQAKYLSLVIKEKDYCQRLMTKMINLCQEELTAWVEEECQLINACYTDWGLPVTAEIGTHRIFEDTHSQATTEAKDMIPGETRDISAVRRDVRNPQETADFRTVVLWRCNGDSNINNYSDINQTELTSVEQLSDIKFTTPNFELTNFISLSILEESSKMLFDYNLFQSSWFRLIVTVAFGFALFHFTGRLVSFIFFIFQIINLLTGKDVRTMKLKQQTKELKRKVGSQYQSLVRFLTDRAFCIIISALEEKEQQYQEKLEELIKNNEEKLNQIKQKISHNQERLNNLKEDEITISSLI